MTPASPAERLREIAAHIDSYSYRISLVGTTDEVRAIAADIEARDKAKDDEMGELRVAHALAVAAAKRRGEERNALRDALKHALGCLLAYYGKTCPHCEAARGLLKEGR